jgi:hypothetical protein
MGNSEAGRESRNQKPFEFSEKSLRRLTLAFVREVTARGRSNGGDYYSFVGCTVAKFRRHIESQFLEGMRWGNWGRGRGNWEFDHIKPVASFPDLTQEDQFRECAHYTNIRPLWSDLNHLRVVPGLESLSAKELCELYDEDFAMLVRPKLTARNGKPCYEIDLRTFGFGRVFGETEAIVNYRRHLIVSPDTKPELPPVEKIEPEPFPLCDLWRVDMRGFGGTWLYAETKEAVVAKYARIKDDWYESGIFRKQLSQTRINKGLLIRAQCLHTVGAVGSIPTASTTLPNSHLSH